MEDPFFAEARRPDITIKIKNGERVALLENASPLVGAGRGGLDVEGAGGELDVRRPGGIVTHHEILSVDSVLLGSGAGIARRIIRSLGLARCRRRSACSRTRW